MLYAARETSPPLLLRLPGGWGGGGRVGGIHLGRQGVTCTGPQRVCRLAADCRVDA